MTGNFRRSCFAFLHFCTYIYILHFTFTFLEWRITIWHGYLGWNGLRWAAGIQEPREWETLRDEHSILFLCHTGKRHGDLNTNGRHQFYLAAVSRGRKWEGLLEIQVRKLRVKIEYGKDGKDGKEGQAREESISSSFFLSMDHDSPFHPLSSLALGETILARRGWIC